MISVISIKNFEFITHLGYFSREIRAKRPSGVKILTSLYSLFSVTIFLILCVFFVPIMLLLCQKKSWHPLALRLHTTWARSLLFLACIPVRIEWKYKPDKQQQYIFCANHFSYLDIPSLFLIGQAKFIGKSSMNKIPLFGYFYRKTHITVNRSSPRSRAESLKKAREATEEGFNLAFFPEGGVKVKEKDIPQMVPFMDGAFILSAEKNIPILPVTLATNYQILPDRSPIRLYRHICRMIVHPPELSTGSTDECVKNLKDRVFEVIQSELNAHHQEKVLPVQ